MTSLHHAAILVADIDVSLQFWRDGVGLDVVMDRSFDGDWRTLFGIDSDRLRSVFLGDPRRADAGIIELVHFDGPDHSAARDAVGRRGFFLLSCFVDVDATLERLATLGFGGPPRRITVPGPDNGEVAMATVVDPDGVLVELIGAA